jgi:ubiquinone/menaquinone biosynthesis C-methylase UbiE
MMSELACLRSAVLDARKAVTVFKAAAEPTRLRILLLLAAGDLNVKDLTRILGQSQPRISRHLKLLSDAGLIERSREGSWVYFHLSGDRVLAPLLGRLIGSVDPADAGIVRDRERADALKAEREQAAQSYFVAHAAEWDKIRSLHVSEADVEAAMVEMLGDADAAELLVDLGTGTGRILELMAGRYQRAIGFDANNAMLAYARSKLSARGLVQAQVRHGDIYDVQLPDAVAGIVVMHQVLHFLGDPAGAIREAARVLAPGGQLLIADFAPHELEYLRERFAHERLGFSRTYVDQLIADAGLTGTAYRELAPAGGGDKLTVSLWLAVKSDAKGRHQSDSKLLSREKAA